MNKPRHRIAAGTKSARQLATKIHTPQKQSSEIEVWNKAVEQLKADRAARRVMRPLAKREGMASAMMGRPRMDNPYQGSSKAAARQEWFDGWDEAMIPDIDEQPGGGPL